MSATNSECYQVNLKIIKYSVKKKNQNIYLKMEQI